MNLLVTDFDGTFYDINYKKNIELIKKYNNLDFVIATGRNFTSLKNDLKINCKYYICNDGGYILDNNHNLIYRNYIDSNTVSIIYSRIKNLGYNDYFFDNINTLNKNIVDNVNKIAIKIENNNTQQDMDYLLKDLSNIYAYVSTDWINIISMDSKKENAVDFISKLNKYDNIYTIGNDINDYDMVKKYNGYFITDKENKEFNTLKSFLELESIIKND